jgi:hypothetical protein
VHQRDQQGGDDEGQHNGLEGVGESEGGGLLIGERPKLFEGGLRADAGA